MRTLFALFCPSSVGLYFSTTEHDAKREASGRGANVQSAINKQEVEREELAAFLASGMLGRTNNLVRLLSFVCDKYFAGQLDEIKEYNIAVEALGRPEDFDPQVDTIVRVTAHALRKRLEDYYRSAGAQHSVHICLPPGHYVPKFIHKSDLEAGSHTERIERNGFDSLENAFPHEDGLPPALAPALRAPASGDEPPDQRQASLPKTGLVFSGRILAAASIVVLAALVLLSFTWYKGSRSGVRESQGVTRGSFVATGISGQVLRAMAGDNRAQYVDRAGVVWESDRFCSGGNSFSVAGHVIQGTEDPQIFSAGRHGTFHCAYPLPPGTYEVHLMFAETAGLLENARNVAFTVNGGAATNLDVVDDAGGDDIATTKVFTDVKPEADGMIHLDFNTPNSFLNAVEIMPGLPHGMLPVRIVAGPSIYRDSQGNTWLPDRYFFGGRVNHVGSDLSKLSDGHIFEWHRYGHFHYTVPVAPGNKYTLKLYFLEHWFGAQNGSVGGVGSRVFDVSCDGVMLLKGFDIFKEAGAGPLVKTFNHIEPTPQGKIEIYFTPAINYPSVSGIEVIPE
jgi:Malectin domain